MSAGNVYRAGAIAFIFAVAGPVVAALMTAEPVFCKTAMSMEGCCSLSCEKRQAWRDENGILASGLGYLKEFL